jgi:hypothetical protein
MRQFLTAAFLGAALAFGASAALADEKVDYVPSYQRTQSVPVVSRTVTRAAYGEPVVAGGSTVTSVYREQREDNREH